MTWSKSMGVLAALRRPVHWIVPLAAAWFLAADAGAQERRWGPTPVASAEGHRVDDLFMLITALIAISFLIMLVLLLVPPWRDRARDGHKAKYDHGTSLHDKRFTAMTSIIVFFLLDAIVLYISLRDLREAVFVRPEGDDVVQVEVLAQQWAWNFRHPGEDGEFGSADDIVTINELVLPNGRPVVLNLMSKDVIHSFFLPDMRVKRDLNPGAVNTLFFEPEIAGTYDLICAELCGFAHYQMGGKVRVLESAEYETWHDEASMMAQLAYNPDDTEAQWAWDWQE